MKALTLHPQKKNSLDWREVPEPPETDGDLLCQTLAIGVCGTDRELAEGLYGEAPAGRNDLIIGHESLGKVLQAGPKSDFKPGDFVVGFVRHPDPAPCAHCAVGEWDLCENDGYTEHGIRGRNGFASERFRIPSEHALKSDPRLENLAVLTEPASVVAKSWEFAELFRSRSRVPPKRALVIGAGPVGLFAALMGRQRGLEVHVFDRHESGPKPQLTRKLGAVYHSSLESLRASKRRFDFTFECTGSPELMVQIFQHLSSDGILCLLGLSPGENKSVMNLGKLNQKMVLRNELIFGSVNANRRHYEKAQASLLEADPNWLRAMITRQVPFPRWKEAFEKRPDDLKVLLIPETL